MAKIVIYRLTCHSKNKTNLYSFKLQKNTNKGVHCMTIEN